MDDLSQLWAEEGQRRFADSRGEISPRTAEICDSFLAGLYFLLTVQQLLAVEPKLVAELAAPEAGNGACTLTGDGALQGLARARAALGVNPYLGAGIIRDTRNALSRRPGRTGLFADIESAFLRT